MDERRFTLSEGEAMPTSYRIVRGAMLGTITIAAIAVWSITFEPVLLGKVHEGWFMLLVRIFFCDAVPLAILLGAYRALGTDESCEKTIRGIIGSVLWFIPREPPRPHEEF